MFVRVDISVEDFVLKIDLYRLNQCGRGDYLLKIEQLKVVEYERERERERERDGPSWALLWAFLGLANSPSGTAPFLALQGKYFPCISYDGFYMIIRIFQFVFQAINADVCFSRFSCSLERAVICSLKSFIFHQIKSFNRCYCNNEFYNGDHMSTRALTYDLQMINLNPYQGLSNLVRNPSQ